MSEPLTRSMYADGADDQTLFRERAQWYDQHDRLWVGQREKRSGHPTGVLSLQQKTPLGNRAPWEPDQTKMTVDPNDPTAINIDYDAILTERLQAREDWNALGIDRAAANSWDIPEKDQYGYFLFEDRIVKLIGERPKSWVPVKAAMDGNRWILGFTDTVDNRIAPFVERKTRREQLTGNLPSFATTTDDGATVLPEKPQPRSRAARVRANQQGAA